ncbi:MAG: DNA-binding domain-containing protein [Hyphomicrobiaceae bacterium]|nr:DNA-binding domain-containing protein [Hyphomicrobiaceae bacterium]
MVWDKQQALFAKNLLDPTRGVPDFVTRTAGEPSGKRFNVYRNNVMVSLTQALLDSYPVVAQLVGEEFATAMARVFAGEHLPTSPVMLNYGAGYGDFIAAFEPAQSLPYLADVARLEWAWLAAYHSADQTPLAIDALSAFGEEDFINLCFAFCPDVQLLQSDHRVVSIWSSHQKGEGEGEGGKVIDFEASGQEAQCALLTRPLFEVELRVINRGTHAFLHSLKAGLSLGKSIDKGHTFKEFEPAQALETLFTSGCVAALKKHQVHSA